MSAAFEKVVRLGQQRDVGSTFAKIAFDGTRLSITGVEGPMRNGNCRGSCGQIDMHPWTFESFAPGWDAERAEEFRQVWRRWHFNDVRAGSPRQRQYLELNPAGDYSKAVESLRAAGLQPDEERRDATGRAYSYGSAWLLEQVPDEVVEWLRALPDADVAPAWV